jgi:hypothetical protein
MATYIDLVKSTFENQPLPAILRSSVAVLNGVNAAQESALQAIGVVTVFDLALSPLFRAASDIVEGTSRRDGVLIRHGGVPAGLVDSAAAGAPVETLPVKDLATLAGLDTAQATTLATTLGTSTIRDLALWPPYRTARDLVARAYNPPTGDEDAATELVPRFGDYATESVYYQQLVIIDGPTSATTPLIGPVDLLAQPATGDAPCTGALLTFQQTWTPQAVALGQLLYALPLAAGESTKIAVIDWTRRTRTAAEETVDQRESLTSSLSQARSISEVASTVANETQNGYSTSTVDSISGTVAGALAGGGAGAGTGGGAGAGAIAGAISKSVTTATSVSGSAGHRDVTSEYGQRIASSTEQASLSERSRKAALVTEAVQQEREEISTRTVTNYNHMHALNVLYFEVVQLYRVTLKLSKAERVIFVPMKPLKFEERTVFRFRSILARAALDTDVRSWLVGMSGSVSVVLEAPRSTQIYQILARDQHEGEVPKPERMRRAKEIAKAKSRLRVSFAAALRSGGVLQVEGGHAAWQMAGDCELINVGWDPTPARVSRVEVTTEEGLTMRVETNGGMDVRQDLSVNRDLGVPLAIVDLRGMALVVSEGEQAQLQNVRLFFKTSAGIVFAVNCDCVISRGRTRIALASFSAEDSFTELVQHLNEHALHYSQAVWRGADPQLLSGVLARFTFDGKRLIDYLDTAPIAATGNYLVFRWQDDDDRKWQDWRAKKVNDGYADSRLVALPTGGVFAESVPGRSNCAEKLDLTRFWNWQDSPPPVQAPDIAAIQAGQHTVQPADRPGGLDQPVLNIVNPPALPDPTGLGAAMAAALQPSLFRDMSGLAATAALAQAGMQGTLGAAGQALNTVGNLTGGALSQFGGGGTRPGATARGGGGGAGIPIFASGGPAGDPLRAGLGRRLSPATSNISNTGGLLNYAHQFDEARATNGRTTGRPRGGEADAQFAAFRSVLPGAEGGSLDLFAAGAGGSRLARESRVLKEGEGVADAVVFYLQNPVFDQPVQNRFGQVLKMSTGDFFGDRLILWPRASDIWYLEGDRILSDEPAQFFSMLEFEKVLEKMDRMGWLVTMAEIELNFLIAFTVPLWAIVFGKGVGILAHLSDPNLRSGIVDHGPKVIAGLKYMRDKAPKCLGCIVKNAAIEALKGIPRGIQAKDLAYLVGRVLFTGRGVILTDTNAVALAPLKEIAKANRLTVSLVVGLRASGAAAAGFTSAAQDLLAQLQAEGIPVEGSVPCVKECLEELVNDPNSEAELQNLADSLDVFAPALEKLIGLAMPTIDL